MNWVILFPAILGTAAAVGSAIWTILYRRTTLVEEYGSKHVEFQNKHFKGLPCTDGLLADFSDDPHPTKFFGFGWDGKTLSLANGMTHLGFVQDGEVLLTRDLAGAEQTVKLTRGMYFSCPDACVLRMTDGGRGVAVSRLNYHGHFVVGGPIQRGEGLLKYIDGGSTSLLIPPPLKGDPCLNYLHFPPRHKQRRHKHPSLRFTIVYEGSGKCTVPDDHGGVMEIPLGPGSMFVIPTGGLHAIDADDNGAMDIVTYDPDALVGWTDQHHPMLESTLLGTAPNQLV